MNTEIPLGFNYTFIPQYSKGKRRKECFNMIQRKIRTVTCFNILSHQAIGPWEKYSIVYAMIHPRLNIMMAATPKVKPPVSKEGANVSLNIQNIGHDEVDTTVWANLMSRNQVTTPSVRMCSPGCCQQFWHQTLWHSEGGNRLTFLGLHKSSPFTKFNKTELLLWDKWLCLP